MIILKQILLICIFTYSSPVLANGSNSINPGFTVMLSLNQWDIRRIGSWSGGGGKRVAISKDSHWPFEGRDIGGGDRKTIFGTRMYGSGYPYGVTDQSTVSGRPFPYGVWPIYWGNNYMGSDEYGPALDAIRPGGSIVLAPVSLTKEHQNVTSTETYYIMGDRESVMPILVSMATWCHATAGTPTIFNPNSSEPIIRPENVIQYYRASSFALISLNYNNTAALSSNPQLSSNAESAPLPQDILNSTFRSCMDGAIGNAIPIMDAPLKPPMSTPMLVVMIIGMFALGFLIPLFPWLVSCCRTHQLNMARRVRAKKAALARRKVQEQELQDYP